MKEKVKLALMYTFVFCIPICAALVCEYVFPDLGLKDATGIGALYGTLGVLLLAILLQDAKEPKE